MLFAQSFKALKLWACEAKKEGITIDVNESGPRFVFDFNEGQIATPKDVQKVYQFVQLAKKHGFERSLLTKIAERGAIEQSQFVWWARPYHVHADQTQWISLSGWLEEKSASG